jgi:hypothetical protein
MRRESTIWLPVRVLRLLAHGHLSSGRRPSAAQPAAPAAGDGVLPRLLGPADGYSPVMSFSFAKKPRLRSVFRSQRTGGDW